MAFFSMILPSLSAADLPPGTAVGMKIGMVVGTFLNVAYPIFLLIWFLRGTIRDQVRSCAAGDRKRQEEAQGDQPVLPHRRFNPRTSFLSSVNNSTNARPARMARALPCIAVNYLIPSHRSGE